MASLSIHVEGLDRVSRRLRELGIEIARDAARALRAEAEIEMTEAKKRTPVLTGALRASGVVLVPEADGLIVKMSFGGAAAPYALYVHENLEAFHAVGQAKFLESVLLESAPYLADRIATRVRKRHGG